MQIKLTFITMRPFSRPCHNEKHNVCTNDIPLAKVGISHQEYASKFLDIFINE